MADLTLDVARKILDTALAKGVEKKLKPLVVTVLDARGCVKISAAQDGTSLLRSEIAHGKAYGALAMGLGEEAEAVAKNAFLFEEFLVREKKAGRLKLDLKALPEKSALLHGHCHQKSFGAFKPVEQVLRLIPDLDVETIESSCCGMAGAFGYGADTFEVSMQMAEASLLPAIRRAEAKTLVVADGTSCRHQIADGTDRQAIHVAEVLERALA